MLNKNFANFDIHLETLFYICIYIFESLSFYNELGDILDHIRQNIVFLHAFLCILIIYSLIITI